MNTGPTSERSANIDFIEIVKHDLYISNILSHCHGRMSEELPGNALNSASELPNVEVQMHIFSKLSADMKHHSRIKYLLWIRESIPMAVLHYERI